MKSITLSVELVLPSLDCHDSSAERDGLIERRLRRPREWYRRIKKSRSVLI